MSEARRQNKKPRKKEARRYESTFTELWSIINITQIRVLNRERKY